MAITSVQKSENSSSCGKFTENMEELYTLEREVGRGSYGVVFEGYVAKTGQRVAIKRLPCSSPECIELYLQELWAMRATAENHPNVIALHNCLLQTGPRNLKPLPVKLPLDLVESALKGRVVGAPQIEEGTNSRSNARLRANSGSSQPKLQDGTDAGQARPKLQDKTNLVNSSDARTPKTPRGRPRKRPAQSEEHQVGGRRRCSALWLVMEYCDGGNLNQYLLSEPPEAQRNHSIVRQLSRAVAFLHGLGIIHRDLKPDNVLVCLTPKGPVVKVADFGLSKMSGCLTRQHFSSTCGSDFYMAPEVWGGLSYTTQADIFSLGVMFWAVLERITFIEEGTTQEQLGAYVWKSRLGRLIPLGEALCEDPDLQLSIPMKGRRAPPLPPPLGRATSSLLLDMLASDPDARPTAEQLEACVRSAVMEDSR